MCPLFSPSDFVYFSCFALQVSIASFSLLTIHTRAYEHRLRTLDPVFALLVGFSAAGMRIRREENQKRLGLDTTSIVGSTTHKKSREQPEAGSQHGPQGEIGYGEVASIGWGRVKRRISAAVQWQNRGE